MRISSKPFLTNLYYVQTWRSPTRALRILPRKLALAGLAEAKSKKYDEAMNNNDAAAVATFFTEDAVIMTDTGPVYGRKAVEKSFVELFQKWRVSNYISKRDQHSPHWYVWR